MKEFMTGRTGHPKLELLRRYRYAHRGFHDKPQPLQLPGRPQRDGSLAGTLLTKETAVRDTEGGDLQTAAVHTLVHIQRNAEKIHQFRKITGENQIRILLFI